MGSTAVINAQFPDASAEPVVRLVGFVDNGEWCLPEFQRSYVWDADRSVKLLASTMAGFPIGAFLTLEIDPLDPPFAGRRIEGAPDLKNPSRMVLDGQQRLTSFYRALHGSGTELYFAQLREFLDADGDPLMDPEDIDWDKAVVALPIKRARKDPVQDITNGAWQTESGFFPLRNLLVPSGVDDFIDAYAAKSGSSLTVLRTVRDRYLHMVTGYRMPIIVLPRQTTIAAVCSIFENINQQVVPLGVFELLTARFFKQQIYLRELWIQALEDHPVIADFELDGYALLQAVCLRAEGSAQRSDVLNLRADDIRTHWASVAAGVASALRMMSSELGVLSAQWLPYKMLVVTLAAVWNELEAKKGPDSAKARDKLKQYFWCTVFTGNFDQGANSQAGADYTQLKKWLKEDPKDPGSPEAVRDFTLTDASLAAATTKRRALYRGLIALTLQAGALDFHTSAKITTNDLLTKSIDSHHVFPSGYLAKHPAKGEDGEALESDLVLNRALIDKSTNRGIKAKPPSEYLGEIEQKTSPAFLADILSSQLLPNGSDSGLRADDYGGFLRERLDLVVSEIETVTGQTVTRVPPAP